MTAKQLLKRGEREVASYIKAECSRAGGESQLNELLDFLLDTAKPIDDADRLKWCRALISGGATFEEFSKTVNAYDDTTVCGLVWTTNFVAYRCRTCGLSPCMSLCSDCFHAADHSGHDFNMFRSQAGGACDCGDISVMKSIGFCSRHGPDRPKKSAPDELLTVASIMMPRLLFRLTQHLRDHCPLESYGTYTVLMPDTEPFIEFLQQLSDMGGAMKSVLTKAFTDDAIYHGFLSGTLRPSIYSAKSADNYRSAVGNLVHIPPPPEFADIEELNRPLVHQTLLDELFFWSVKYEFPQKLVTFMLSLLPNDNFKDAFTFAFVEHYSYMTTALMNVAEKPRMANCIVHISVQLLSPPTLAVKMVQQNHLLHIILASLKHLIGSVLTEESDPDSGTTCKVVDCSQTLLRDHCYWPLVSDIINLFSHREVALYFMSNERLLTFWASIITYFQGMNMNVRELSQHVEFEPEFYYAAFSAELEICSSTMWSLLVHLTDQTTVAQTKNVIKVFSQALKKWFADARITRFTVPNPLQMSFHYPLHRYFIMFLNCAVTVQQLNLDDILPPTSFLHLLMIHPLQLLVCYHEILTGLWVRNGHQIRGQAMTYIQSHFCNSTIDADIFLLQVIASQLDPDYMVHTIVDRFHVLHLLSFSSSSSIGANKSVVMSRDQELPMLENMLAFLCTLLGIRTNIGMTRLDITHQEMVTLLCVADRTHSQLIDAMPETCGLAAYNKDYESVLQKVGDFKTPVFEPGGTMQQGKYVPKASVWLSDYNPLHVMMRALYRRELQASLDRFTEFVKLQGLYRSSSNPWPPFRIPNQPHGSYAGLNKLVHCRTMHGLLFTLLHKAVYQKNIPDAIIYYTVHLLELAISIPNPDAGRKKIFIDSRQIDKQFCFWFSSDDIFSNMHAVISHVTVEENQLMETSNAVALHSTSRAVDQDTDEEEDDEFFVDALPPSSDDADASANFSDALAIYPITDEMDVTEGELVNPEDIVGTTLPKFRSQGVTADTSSVTMQMPVNESMITLLLKLHHKFSSSPFFRQLLAESSSSAAADRDSRVGDGAFFVRKVLEKASAASRECADVIDTLCQVHVPTSDVSAKPTGQHNDLEEKRRKAKQRQERLMKEFASRQKKFMEKVIDMDVGTSETEGSDQLVLREQKYDCCICSQSTVSARERHIGLVTLLQPTSFLSHRRRVCGPLPLPLSDSALPHAGNFAKEFVERFSSLMSEFDETSCLMSINIGWQGGVYAQTCGHYLHLACQKSYIRSLRSQNQSQQQGLRIAEGEFWCPMCRQLSNTVLPILPDMFLCADPEQLIPDTEPSLIRHVADVLLASPRLKLSSELSKITSAVMDDLTNCTSPPHRLLVHTNTIASPFLFVSSILRTNLELELDQRCGSPCNPLASGVYVKKPCISFLFSVLNIHCKMLSYKPFDELWSHITGITLGRDSTCQISIYHNDVPLLLKDVIALFIQLVLHMPLSMSKAAYQCIVRALYNVRLVQFAAAMSCKFSSDEQMAWQVKGQDVGCSKLEFLLSRIIVLFSCSGIYDFEAFESQMPAICSDVWSPVSVEAACVENVLPFVRLASLLQFHLFGDTLPSLSVQDHSIEFTQLAQYVGIAPSGSATSAMTSLFVPADCMHWGHGNAASPLIVMEAWCRHLAQAKSAGSSKNRLLLMTDPVWFPPRLFALPEHYEELFDFYRRRKCTVCHMQPKFPALCLVCSQLVCYKGKCCERDGKMECVRHSQECGGGTSLFLVIHSSLILIIRGPRAANWGSVYLDAHSEEDRDLKRGKPLHLSNERYQLLEQLWMSHTFDHACKQWVMHKNEL